MKKQTKTRSSFLSVVISGCTLLLLSYTKISAQSIPFQTIRGQLVDDVSRMSLPGAIVTLSGSGTLSAITDKDGRFVLKNVPIGRTVMKISLMGYEERIISEILVTSGKEVILNLELTEKILSLAGVVIEATGKQSPNNEMATVSSLSFNPDDTKRYAGALGDPSRMISNVAGVVGVSDARNDIIVRGNSPLGLLWQMEGITIPNPNHFGTMSSTGGPVSILNNNNLDKSDFFTGAFPAQYGNALASVFDLRMRNGNADKTELVGEINFAGFELGAEGPFSKKSRASYNINYRYSTISVLNRFGFNAGTGTAIPYYQDINFRLHIPLSPKTQLSVWGLGGPSHVSFYGNEADASTNNLYGDENENLLTSFFKAIAGVGLTTNISEKSFSKLSFGYSRSRENTRHDSISVATKDAHRDWENDNTTSLA